MRTRSILHYFAQPVILGLAVAGELGAIEPDRRIANAAQARDWDAVKVLLDRKADVNGPQPDGGTALHWAAHYDAVEMARSLLAAGAKVDAANEFGVTPLALAAQNASLSMGQLLLSKGASPNAPLGTGETPLMTAAETGNVELVEAMLEAGGHPNVKERTQDQTALMWATAEKHPRVVEALIKAGADVHARSKGGSTPLLFAARSGDLESARHLIAAGADTNAAMQDGHTVLIVAAGSGHGELGILLLNHGADPDAATAEHGITPLHALIMKRPLHAPHWRRPPEHLALTRALLSHGANANAQLLKAPTGMGINVTGTIWPGSSPFVLAARVADIDMLQALAGKSDPALPATNKTTSLMAAAGVGRNEGNEDPIPEENALAAVKLIADLGVDINAADATGVTALHGATNNGYNAIIQFLYDRGVDLNAKDKDGWTALNNASTYRNNFREHKESAALLRKLGALESVPPPKKGY
jgi:ankyrin repeat protein